MTPQTAPNEHNQGISRTLIDIATLNVFMPVQLYLLEKHPINRSKYDKKGAIVS